VSAPAPEQVRVRVNGEPVLLSAGSSVSDLLARLGVSLPRVAVERNREILPRAQYPSTVLGDGDELEVVQFVGGG
jgi:thiamine biosynthesis protein ThiS